MMKRLLRRIAAAAALLVLAGGLAYIAGARVLLDGGGNPYVHFVGSEREQAERLARHRAAQRAAAPPPGVETADSPQAAPAPATPAPAALAATTAERAGPQPAAARPDAPPPPAAASAYWTDFRGPRRDGRYTRQPIAVDWPEDGLTPLYKQPVGGGYASFVIAGGRAFTIEQRGGEEVVAAYDVQSGRELWTNSWQETFRERMGGDGPRATPTWHDGRVYALGGAGELRCLDDRTGRTIWRTNILRDAGASNLQWGMAASPLVVDATVVVLPGGRNGQSVVAYDRATGARAWAALDDQQSYSSPMLVTLAGVRQILVFSASRLAGLAPGDGTLLWEFPWKTPFDVNASQPIVVGDDRVFVSTGYGTGAAVIEIGREGGRLTPREIWRNIRMKNQFTSSVLHEGHVYGLDESILACLDVETGQVKWKGGRYGYGQVLLAGGHLIVLTEGGELVLVRATPESHQEVARSAALEGRTWNHPAVSDGILLVRNALEMAAFNLKNK